MSDLRRSLEKYVEKSCSGERAARLAEGGEKKDHTKKGAGW